MPTKTSLQNEAFTVLQNATDPLADFLGSYSVDDPNADAMLSAVVDAIGWMWGDEGTLNDVRNLTFNECCKRIGAVPYRHRCMLFTVGRLGYTAAAIAALEIELGDRWEEISDMLNQPIGGFPKARWRTTPATKPAVLA